MGVEAKERPSFSPVLGWIAVTMVVVTLPGRLGHLILARSSFSFLGPLMAGAGVFVHDGNGTRWVAQWPLR